MHMKQVHKLLKIKITSSSGVFKIIYHIVIYCYLETEKYIKSSLEIS